MELKVDIIKKNIREEYLRSLAQNNNIFQISV